MTLIELLASLSLLSILLAVLTQCLYTDAHLWAVNDRAYERRYELRFVVRTFDTELESLVNSPFLAEPAISGNNQEFVFWSATQDGLVQIRYRFDEQNQKVLKSKGFWGSKPQENLWLDQVKEWAVEYYRPKTNNWELQWLPTYKNDIPSLVRITVRVKDHKLGSLVFPIRAWHSDAVSGGDTDEE